MKKVLVGLLAIIMLCSVSALGITANAANTDGIEYDIYYGFIYRINAGTTLAEVKAEMATHATDYFTYELTDVRNGAGNYVPDTVIVCSGFSGYMQTSKQSTFILSVIGDLNGDGRVTVSDQTMLKNLIMQGVSYSWNSLESLSADIDGNKIINTADLLAMKNLIMAS